MKTAIFSTIALVTLVLATASAGWAEPPGTGFGASLSNGGGTASTEIPATCRRDHRGRLIRFEKVASYPTSASVRAYFDEWVAFYQDFYQFPADIPARFFYGFDSYKVTYCTVDAVLPGQSKARPTTATGMLSVPRKSGSLSTVAYLHGTSVSFYDAVSNPNIFGEFNENGESFDGPPSNSVFAGAGFVYIAPDYLGLGDSTVPRHRTSTPRPRRRPPSICSRPRGKCSTVCT